ncbi:MAG: transaldolase family protein [Patescibacteria group bacterium]
MKTKIFLDSGDPKETKDTFSLLGFLDGQTTNPSLFAKNPQIQEQLTMGKKFTQDEVYSFYQSVIKEIYQIIPNGSISIEVYADKKTTVDEMLKQALLMNSWIPTAHIKLPITHAGLEVARILVDKNIRVNMTLCFTQQQAAAVYSATYGAKKGQVFISPFIGRLDDLGLNGLDLIKNCLEMYKNGDRHVEVLVASVRSLYHLLASFAMEANIVTTPFSILKAWKEKTKPQSSEKKLKEIKYEEIDLSKPWTQFNINHDLTNIGIEKFCSDWNKLIDFSK